MNSFDISSLFPSHRGHVGKITIWKNGESRKADLYRKNNGQLVYWSPFGNERIVFWKCRKGTRPSTNIAGKISQKTPEEKVEAALRSLSSLYQRFNGLCHWCGKKCERMTTRVHAPLQASRDHVIRKADGGTNHSSNLVLACKRCNNGRHAPGWKPPRGAT